MNNKPLVSVVMPVYNGEKFLPQAIESILNQTYKNFEFIIIDDASTDGSFEIIKKYAKKDKRIKFMRNKKNLGQTEALINSKKLIKGKYFFKMDSDDIANPKRLEKQVNFLENNQNYIIVGSNLKVIDENSKLIGYRFYPRTDEEIRKTIFFKSPFAHPTICFRTSIISRIFYDNIFKYAEDYYLWFKFLKVGKGYNLDDLLVSYRISRSQVKNLQLKNQLKETIKIQKIIFSESKKIPVKARIYHFLHKLLLFLPSTLVLCLFKKIELRQYDKN